MAAKRRPQAQTSENGRSKTATSTQNKHKHGKKNERENGDVSTPSQSSHWSHIGYVVLIAVLACICGILHRNHIAGMFERDRHFSHLSTLERELAFRTEMGLYYSYYKTIVEAPSLVDGLNLIMYDNITEYPDTINTLKRFNLYPEVVLGITYRVFNEVTQKMNIVTRVCWRVNRGEGYSPVQSCEGIGEPVYFYIESVFLLNGINMCLFFLFGSYLSGSIFGGAMAVMSFFYNHGECTRVQWTPPLRESFAYPFLVIEMLIVTYVLRSSRPSYKHSFLIALAVVCFMLPWQFAQFALMTQTVAVFGTYVLQYIGSHKMKIVLLGQSMGLILSYVFLFGNEMLLTSFFASCLLTVTIIVFLEPHIEKIGMRFFIWVVQGILLAVGTVAMKLFTARVLRVADDKHISDIFRSKFGNFKNFHTMLYTCAAEFDFMEKETPWRILKTLLAPCTAVVLVTVGFKLLKKEYQRWKAAQLQTEKENNNGHHGNGNGNGHISHDEEEPCESEHRSKEHAEILYHVFQLLAFTAMAVIIMRLKLFWTPHLCLLSSLIASQKFFGWVGPHYRQISMIALLMAGMSVQGYYNLSHQWSIMGEFSNYPQESLVEWINAKTPPDAVFAGPMPTMATVKLSTGRPIVNHPHYEDAGLRARTKKVYTMYSRKPESEVWENLRDLKVDYVILEESWCLRRSRPGCGMAEIWDLEDKENRGEEMPVCARLHKNPEPYFKRVFRNKIYDVLKPLKVPPNTAKHYPSSSLGPEGIKNANKNGKS